jgi:hypothetical protein
MPKRKSWQDSKAKTGTEESSTELALPIPPVSGITYENYKEQAIAFARAGGKVFTIVRNEDRWDVPVGFYLEPTPRQWGAWMEYFQAKYDADPRPSHIKNRRGNKIAVKMRKLGWGSVPTEWPHQFDADWFADYDNAASNRWWDKHQAWLKERPSPADGPDEVTMRKAHIVNRIGYDPAIRRGAYRPEVKPLDNDIAQKIEDGTWSSADLKTPTAPVRSDELKKLLDRSEGL